MTKPGVPATPSGPLFSDTAVNLDSELFWTTAKPVLAFHPLLALFNFSGAYTFFFSRRTV
jgi:hypothetical protein